MRAFIVRPFGTKNDKRALPIDFDAVERELIDPALDLASASTAAPP